MKRTFFLKFFCTINLVFVEGAAFTDQMQEYQEQRRREDARLDEERRQRETQEEERHEEQLQDYNLEKERQEEMRENTKDAIDRSKSESQEQEWIQRKLDQMR